ncbi:HIT domain-containing protein [Candidatus Woesearchaeota archaeon]|nr:HIT domain-containing protein [Candidatus Woesearchaeota archaeon]
MQLSAEQQKAVEAQKAQCPFCKIVKGEIPSKKIYEDDKILAILDINPAAKGHLLVLPKEHYPIMPLIPPDIFEYLFLKTKQLSAAMKEGLLLFGDTLFIANGYAAGQQSSHFMLHLVPRETNDGLDSFTPKKAVVDRVQADDAFKLLKHNLPIMLRQRAALFPIPGMEQQLLSEAPTEQSSSMTQPSLSVEQSYASPIAPSVSSQPSPVSASPFALKRPTVGYTKESVIKLIESNEQLKELVMNYPSQFKEQIEKNQRLKQAFASLDVDDIIAYFAPAAPIQPKYTIQELVAIVNDNPQLKEMLLKQTLQFAEAVSKIPELQELFGGIDIEELERAVLAYDVHQEQDVQAMLGSFTTKKTREHGANDLLSSPALKNLEPHLDIPEAENPALIQEEDESLQNVEESEEEHIQDSSPQNQESEEEQETEKQQELSQEEEPQETSEEKKKSEQEPEDDLITRLHKEMLRRKT